MVIFKHRHIFKQSGWRDSQIEPGFFAVYAGNFCVCAGYEFKAVLRLYLPEILFPLKDSAVKFNAGDERIPVPPALIIAGITSLSRGE